MSRRQPEPAHPLPESNAIANRLHAITFFKRHGGGTGAIHSAETPEPSRTAGRPLNGALPR